MLHRFSCLLWLSFFVCFAHAELHDSNNLAQRVDIIISSATDDYEKQIEKAVQEPFLVKTITFGADVVFDPEEIRYLLGFKEGDSIDSTTLTKAAYYLFLKNKFSTIEFIIEPADDGGKALIMKFTSIWTVKGLKIKGFMLGKDMYRQYYLMEPGNIFDEKKHRESLTRIIGQFKETGYFKASVDDSLSYDAQTKSVSVTLVLHPGPRFTIERVSCAFNYEDISADDIAQLKIKVLDQLTKHLQHKSYTKSLLNKEIAIIKKLLFRNGFAQTNLALTEKIDRENETVNLCLEIEIKKSKEFVFSGNHQFSRAQLLDVLLSFGRATWFLPPSILAQEITNYYKEQGFWQVAVTAKEEKGRLSFMINEGGRANIKKIALHGLHYFEQDQCIKNYFQPVLVASTFDTVVLKESIDELLDQYNKVGYFDAKVVSQQLVPLVAMSDCRLELTIDEGKQYLLQSVVVDQFPELASGCLGVDGRNERIACTYELFEAQKKWLQEQMALKGFADAPLSLELIREGKAVTAIWHVDLKRAQVHFGKTVIVGNGSLPSAFLTRELPFKSGDPFDLNLVQQALKKLRSLDLFDSVSISPDQAGELLPERPMIMHVQPSEPFEVQLRFGVGLQQMTRPVRLSSLTYKVGGAFIIKNPFNLADHFRLNVDASRAYRDVVMRYERPWIFDRPIKLFAQGYSSSYKQPGFFTFKEGLYEVWQQGFLAGVSREYEHANAAITGGIEWMNTAIRKEYAPVAGCVIKALDINPRLVNHSIPYFFIEPTLMLDFTDNRLNPSRGSFTLFSIKGILPLNDMCGSLHSIKCLLEQSVYIPLGPFNMTIRGRGGYIGGLPLENVQLVERFYMGGAHSIRSYYPDCTPPLGSFCDAFGRCQYVPQGGKVMAQGTVEMRFPLMGALSGVVFQDIGSLSDNPTSVIKGGNLLAATGCGLRYDTPIGPLRFDIGWKWARHDTADHAYAWYVALGNVF